MQITMHFEQAIVPANDEARARGHLYEDFDLQQAFREVAAATGHQKWTGLHGGKVVQLTKWRDRGRVCYIAAGAFVPHNDTTVLAMDVGDNVPPDVEAFPPPQSKEFLQQHIAALLDRHNVLWCATRRGTPSLLASLLFDMQQKLGVAPQKKVTFKKPLAPDVVRLIERHGVVSIDAQLAASRADIERARRGGLSVLDNLIYKPRAEGEAGDLKATIRLAVGKRGFSAEGESGMLARELAQELLNEDPDDITLVFGDGTRYKANQLGQRKTINVQENGDTFQIFDAFSKLAEWRDELIRNGEIAE